MSFDINTIPWSEPKIIRTKLGLRRVRSWPIPEQSSFWHQWRTTDMKGQGYTVTKWQGAWTVTEWRSITGGLVARPADGQQVVRPAAPQPQLEQELPEHLQRNFQRVVAIYQQIHADTGHDYSYQLPSIKALAISMLAFDSALDASDTGTGKTFVACAVAKVLDLALFVVCPKSVMPPWERAARVFDLEIQTINYELLRRGSSDWGDWQRQTCDEDWPEDEPLPLKRPLKFQYQSIDPAKTLFVFDECHRMKDYKTLNCALGLSALDEQFKVLALSATAADNPMHMKFVALLTGLIQRPSHYYGWMSEHGVKRGKFGLQFVGGHDVLSRIHHAIFPQRGSRIRIADLGDLFPQTTVISEAYQMDETLAIQHIYTAMREEILKLEESKSKDRGANILTVMLLARQEVELLKVPNLLQMAKDALAEDMSVVVILNFDATIKALTRRLRTANTITGADDPRVRQQLIDAFNADDEQLLVMNIKAGGLGISLHGTTSSRTRLVLVSPTFSGIDLKQALGRCHRAGGARSIQKIVWAAGTVEEKACDKVRKRLQRVSIFNDDQLDESLAI